MSSGGGGSVAAGYRYSFGILMGLCRGPINGISEITVGDKRAWIGKSGNQNFNLIADLRVPIRKRTYVYDSDKGESGGMRLVYIDLPLGVITAAYIDTDGDGIETPLTLGVATPISKGGVQIGTVNVAADGTFIFVANPAYLYQHPKLRYVVFHDSKSSTRFYDIGGALADNANVEINAYELFGGESKEGGVQGTLQVKMGAYTQTMAGTNYAAMRPGPLPGLRRMATVFFDGIVCMMNPYPKPWKFRLWRTTAGWENDSPWYPERAEIAMAVETAADFSHIKAMNAVHIIYECLTNHEWGRGMSASALDDASWRAAADTIYAEKFGLCIRWSRKDSIDTFINSIKNHIAASIFTDRRTGLLSIKLVRGGYSLDDLPLFTTESGIRSISGGETVAIASAVNHVQVKYRDPVTNEDRTVSAGNVAARLSANGTINTMTKEYAGIPVPSLALRVAQRDLKAYSTGVQRFEITMDRRGHFIHPGSVIAIQDPKRGIPKMAIRVGQVDFSNYRDGTIKIIGLRDIFSTPSTSFAASVPTTWQKPSTRPCISKQRVIEVPYFMLVRKMTPAELDYVLDDVGHLGTMASPGSGMNAKYDIAVRDGAPTLDDQPVSNEYNCG